MLQNTRGVATTIASHNFLVKITIAAICKKNYKKLFCVCEEENQQGIYAALYTGCNTTLCHKSRR
jgi:hypothetical protein